MATVEFKGRLQGQLKSTAVRAGWFNTGIHPGYPGRPSKATVAQVAKYNTHTRDFATLFVNKYFREDRKAVQLIAKDIQMALKTGKFDGALLADYMMDGLIQTIRLAPWQPNTEQWLKFKAKHGLSLDPLVASQVMLNDINTQVQPL